MRIYILLVLAFMIASCSNSKRTAASKSKNTQTDQVAVIKDSVEVPVVKMKKLEIGGILRPLHINFDLVEMKGDMELQNKSDNYSFTFNIRMRKDSIIWMQLKKFGLEGARVLATKDSLFAVDRLHRTFLKKSWSQIQTQMNAPIDFQVLYEIIAGNAVYFPKGIDSLRTTENMKYLSSQNDDKRIEIGINAVFNEMITYVIRDLKKENVVNIKLGDYKLLYDEKKFSYLRDIEILSDNVKLLYVNLAFDEVNRNQSFKTPFEIPVGYKPME